MIKNISLYLLLKMGNGINGDKIDKYLIIKSIRDYYFSDERGLKKVQKFIEGDEGNIRKWFQIGRI